MLRISVGLMTVQEVLSEAGTLQPLLPKTVTVYYIDYETGEWYQKEVREYVYENGYPVRISSYDYEEEAGSKVTYEYAFDNGVPTARRDFDESGVQTEAVEYNEGRVYRIAEMTGDNTKTGAQYYQYGNRDAYFTLLLRESHFNPPEGEGTPFTMEEVDSVSVVTEHGLLRSTVNTGMYANWNEGEEKEWQRFNGTYAAKYDANGILSETFAYFRMGPSGAEERFDVTKENGIVTQVIKLRQDYEPDEWSGAEKFVFEYTDIEISPARYAAMVNNTILGDMNNYYCYFWY